MTEKPNFFKLGLFLLLAVVLLVAGLILFSSGVFAKEKVYYETYFADSVQGLDRGSNILLNGVQMGIVEEVDFVISDYGLSPDTETVSKYDQYIRVVFYALLDKLPRPRRPDQERLQYYIDRGLRLRLASNLITGQAYLEAVFLDPERYPIMEIPWTPQYTYIPSAPSAFRSMQASVDTILQKIGELDLQEVIDDLRQVLDRADQALADAEINAVSKKAQQLIDTLDQAVKDVQVGALREKTTALMDELRQSNRHLHDLLANPDPRRELDNLAVLIDQFNQTLRRLDQLIVSQSPELKEAIDNIRQVSENLNYFSERIKDNPSEFLLSQPPERREEQE